MKKHTILLLGLLVIPAQTLWCKDYKAGEIRTQVSYKYGRFEVRMLASQQSGILSTFFTFNDDNFTTPQWNELDVEVLGRYNNQVQFNVITYNHSMHEHVHMLSENPGQCFINYAIEWAPSYVAWYINGAEVYRDSGTYIQELTFTQKFMINHWPTNLAAWAGVFDPSKLPAYAFYDWAAYYAYTPGSGNYGGGNNFTLQWKDDFNSWDGSRWSKATHTFAENEADFIGENAVIKDGHLVLAVTNASQLGFNGSIPPGCGASTPTLTPSRTPTSTRTSTPTPTATPTRTATRTPTTPPNTPTATSTRTATATPSRTYTFTPTRTPTTPPNTPTATSTRTATATPTASWTRTHTSLPNTPTWTYTPTVTHTGQPTSTHTSTRTTTSTPTATSTGTHTATATPTRTATLVPNTPTHTNTGQPTSTSTATSTTTSTRTSTPTGMPTASPSQTHTATSTFSPTPTPTATIIPPTPTHTAIPTATFTHTPTVSMTPTAFLTATTTVTNTMTVSATPTITSSPTPPAITIAVGANPPANHTQPPGALDAAVMQVEVTNPSSVPVTLTSLALNAAGSGDDQAGITGVQVYLDNNGDGAVDAGDNLLGTGVYPFDNGMVTFALNQNVSASSSLNLLVVYDFSTAAPQGSYQANLIAGGVSGTSPYGSLQFTGLPVVGAVITIAHPTATPSSTATVLPSETLTATSTRTATPVPTATSTPTLVPTDTSTPSATRTGTPSFTPTATATPSVTATLTHTPSITMTPTATEQPGIDHPIIYPNPSTGSGQVQIHIPGRTQVSDVTVQIFTVAFRLVQQQVFPQVPTGANVSIDLTDKSGKPLASGLYYVVVTVDGKRTVEKLLILR